MTETPRVQTASTSSDQGDRAPVAESAATSGGWGDLFSKQYAAQASIMAGGVALYAMNLYFTAALLPSIVEDIGGARFYAWVATGFLIAAVTAAMLVSRLLARFGPSRSYLTGFLVFAAGAGLTAASPSMETLIVGRIVQGLGGGLMAGLGYAVIRTALPERLWTRAAGLVSAMWGVGTLVGPSLGGLFAELNAWRGSYVLLMAAALVLAVLARRSLPGPTGSARTVEPLPLPSLLLLTLAAGAFSISSTVPRGWATALCIVLGLVLLAGFLLVERRGSATVLPKLTYRRGNHLKWIYLTVAVYCTGVMTETFIPLFGQELGGLSPLAAGFLGATVSVGWTSAQLFSVNLSSERARSLAIRVGPAVLTAGLLAYGLLQTSQASGGRVLLWAVVLVIGGTGIGAAFPHLSVTAMRSTDDEVEGAKAAAGLNTTQLIAFTVSSALAGTLVSFGGDSTLDGARYMVFGLGALTVFGTATAALSLRRARAEA
ncbi:MFS transporter [Kitasatospora purpeofusca]|uniref:MFS transporter n=1 Tax=Kitasatospora purpeofusca TaxID=67352 RepID=UPI002E147F5F|nr:MFS transporter [Kitasatospora purpeofusca]WSR39461.1 MFS transporter [Kitasatospora purpeofusca]